MNRHAVNLPDLVVSVKHCCMELIHNNKNLVSLVADLGEVPFPQCTQGNLCDVE